MQVDEEQLQILRELFSECDLNKDGRIDREELKATMIRLGSSEVTDAEVDTLLDTLDKKGKGYIDFEEFVNGVGGLLMPDRAQGRTPARLRFSSSNRPPSPRNRSRSNTIGSSNPTTFKELPLLDSERVSELFTSMDTEKQGWLTVEQTKQAILSLRGSQTDGEAVEIFVKHHLKAQPNFAGAYVVSLKSFEEILHSYFPSRTLPVPPLPTITFSTPSASPSGSPRRNRKFSESMVEFKTPDGNEIYTDEPSTYSSSPNSAFSIRKQHLDLDLYRRRLSDVFQKPKSDKEILESLDSENAALEAELSQTRSELESIRETNHVLLEQLDASKLKLQGLKKKLKQSDKIKEQNNELLENMEKLKEELEDVKKQQQHHKKMNEKLQSQSKELNKMLDEKTGELSESQTTFVQLQEQLKQKSLLMEELSTSNQRVKELEQELTSVRQLLSEKSSRDDMVNALLIENERLARMLSSQPVLVTPQRTPTPMSPDNSLLSIMSPLSPRIQKIESRLQEIQIKHNNSKALDISTDNDTDTSVNNIQFGSLRAMSSSLFSPREDPQVPILQNKVEELTERIEQLDRANKKLEQEKQQLEYVNAINLNQEIQSSSMQQQVVTLQRENTFLDQQLNELKRYITSLEAKVLDEKKTVTRLEQEIKLLEQDKMELSAQNRLNSPAPPLRFGNKTRPPSTPSRFGSESNEQQPLIGTPQKKEKKCCCCCIQ